MDEYSTALVEQVRSAVPGWVERSVAVIATAFFGELTADLSGRAADAGVQAAIEVGDRLAALLSLDVDAQRSNPLSILRDAVRYPTEVLHAAGVPPVERDDFAERAFPDDRYGLTPATWSDIDPALQEPGIIWGAWKAQQVLERRRRER